MPKVGSLGDKINVYIHVANEHRLPHFHVRGPGWRVSIAIGSWKRLIGQAPAGMEADIIQWAEANEELLRAKWSEYHEQQN